MEPPRHVVRVRLGNLFFVIEQNSLVVLEESTTVPRLAFRPQGEGGEIWWLADCSPRVRKLLIFESVRRDFLREVNQQ